MDLVKVEGHDNLARDRKTGAIINTDTNQYNEWVAKMKREKSISTRVESLEEKMDMIIHLLSSQTNKHDGQQ